MIEESKKYNKYGKNATPNFEKRYNPNEKSFSLVKIRENNIKKINDIIKEKQEIVDEFSKRKTEIVRGYSEMETSYSLYMDLDLENLEEQKEIELMNIDKKIRREIKKQTKFFNILKNNEDKYEYYKLISSMPLDGNYKNIEENIYDEYMMSNPEIENIIISYSMLNAMSQDDEPSDNKNIKDMLKQAREAFDQKILDEAKKLVTALDDSIKEKKELEQEVELIQSLIDTKKYIEMASNSFDKRVWDNAYLSIDSLLECKENFKVEFKKIVKENTDKFAKLAKELKDKLDRKEKLDSNKVEELARRYELLRYDSEVWKDDHKRNTLKSIVTDIINYNNNQIQEERKKSIAEDEEFVKNNKKGLKSIISEVVAFPVRLIRRAKKYGKHLLNKIEKTEDEEKKLNLTNIYHERDIANSGNLFINYNMLNKLRFKLFKDGLSDREGKKLVRKANNVTNSVDRSISNMENREMEEIYADEQRTICIIKQYMENLSITECSEEELKEYAEKVKLFINNSNLDELTKNAYYEEINNMCSYKEIIDNQYVYSDGDIEEIKKNDSELPYVKKM